MDMLLMSIFLLTCSWMLCGIIIKAYKIYNPLFLFFLLLVPQVISILIPIVLGDSFNFRFFSNYLEAQEYLTFYFVLLSGGIIFLTVGYLLSFYISYPQVNRTNKVTIFSHVTYLPLLITITIYALVLKDIGGFYHMMVHYNLGAKQFVNVAGLVSQLSIGYLTCFILIINNKIIKAVSVFLVVTLILFTVGERGAVLFSGVIPCLVLYFKLKGKVELRKIIFSLFLFLVMYLVIGSVRDSKKDGFDIDNKIKVSLSKIETQINAAAALKLADTEGYLLGENYINIFYAFIPRAYWSEKPVISESGIIGMRLKNVSESAGAGLPPGPIAYAYLNFGLLGVFFLMSLGGLLAGVMFNFYIKTESVFFSLIYVKVAPLLYYFHSTEVQVKIIMPIAQIAILYFLGIVLDCFFKKGRIGSEKKNSIYR